MNRYYAYYHDVKTNEIIPHEIEAEDVQEAKQLAQDLELILEMPMLTVISAGITKEEPITLGVDYA